MALIRCAECKAEVSDTATACPKCGAPMEISKKKQKSQVSTGCGCLIVLLVVGGIIAAFVANEQGGGRGDTHSPSAGPETPKRERPGSPSAKGQKPVREPAPPNVDPAENVAKAKKALAEAERKATDELEASAAYQRAKADLKSARERMTKAREAGNDSELAKASQDYLPAVGETLGANT